MSYHDGASSNLRSLWQSQPGIGRSSALVSDPANDHRSTRSADSRNARSPLGVSEVGVVTPAQAYASAVKTGEIHDLTLYHTIERRQPERKGKPDPQFVPSHLGDPGSPERGLSFAQRLYASALSDKSSTLPSSNIPVLPQIKHASSSALPTSTGSQASCGVPHRKTLPSTSLLDISSEVSQSFNSSDLYHSSVATHGFPSRGSISPEVTATSPSSLLPVLQIPNSLPVVRLSHPANPFAPYSSSQNFTPQSGVQNSRPALHVSIEPQSHGTSVLGIHEASCIQGVSVGAHQDFHPPAAAGGAIPSPLEQQVVIPPSSSPPPFEEHERLSNLFEEAVADITPVVIRPPVVVPRGDGLPDSSLQPPPEANHEEVPLYSLVDEQLPPPPFDDLQVTSAAEAAAERFPMAHPETSPQEVIGARSSQSPPPSQPPPFSCGSTAYVPRIAPAYALLDQTSYSVGTRKDVLRDAKTPLSSIATWHPSDLSSSDPPSVVPTDFKWSDQPPSMSPIPPSSTVPHDGPSVTRLLPSNSRPLSVLSFHFPDSQSTSTPCDPLATRKCTTSSPPLVNYHTKPTARQSGQPFLPPVALESGSRPPEGSNTVSQARHDSRPLVNAAEDNEAIENLTRSMSDIMGVPSSGTHSLAYENPSSGRLDILGASLGNQQNIHTIPPSHPSGIPSGIPNTIGSLNQERYRSEAERLIQEAYRRPTHAETGWAGYGIQGLGSANSPVATNILSSRHSPRTILSLGSIPPAYSHELQTEPFCTAGDEETVAPSASRASYSDRPNTASVPGRSFPYSLQPSHYPMNRDVHGPVVPAGPVPPQQQKIHSHENLDPMKRGGRALPPPPPPPIALQPTNASQMPQTSSYSQDSAKDQLGPGNKGPALSANDLARKFAHDALLAPSSAPAHAFYRSNQL